MADQAARKDSFTWNGATVGVRELTIADDLRVTALARRAMGGELNQDDPEFVLVYGFAEFMIAADIKGDAPLPLVDEVSTDGEIADALDAWRNLPRKFGRKWLMASNAANADDDPN